jgi:exodeoxyribonuclease-1
VVIGNLKTLPPAMAERWGVDMTRALEHAEVCAHRGASMAGIWPDVFAPAGRRSAVDVDEDLYGGFLGPQDRTRLDRLRKASPDDPAWQTASFDDPRLEELVFRYRARNFPDSLGPTERERWEQLRVARLHEGAGGLTVARFLERVDELAEAAAEQDDERGQLLLEALVDYAEQIAPAHG